MKTPFASFAALSFVVSLIVVFPGLAPTIGAQPGPDHQKLQYWNGKWQVESEIKPSASFAGGKLSGTEECETFANLHVVCTAELTGSTGLYRAKRTISYVPALKQYAQYTIDSLGYASLALGTLQGNTWTFTTDIGGAKIRGTTKASNASATTTTEYAGADGKWIVTATSKATRAKS